MAVAGNLAGSWIDGAAVTTGGQPHRIIDPATGAAVADYALATPADVERCLLSSR